jgi:malonyl-CoA O-methyltransferase
MHFNVDRIAHGYDHYAVLEREIADRLMDRLLFFREPPKRILEIACSTGYFTEKLSLQYPDAEITAIDISPAMIHIAEHKQLKNVNFIVQDIFESAFKAGQFDAIVFNLFPCDHADLPRLMERCYAWLSVDGVLMFSTYGVDTLKEMRAAFAAVDEYAHVNEYIDMHLIGDLLLKMGFFQPVMNAEWVTMTYRSLQSFWEDLRGIGSRLYDDRKRLGLFTPRQFKIVEATYDTLKVDDLYPATYEITFGMAFKSAEQAMKDGVVRVPVEAISRRGI